MEQVMKDVNMKTWLESCAFRAIDIINQGVDPRPKEYQRLRYRRYPKTLPINIKRHLVLSSLRELYFIERTVCIPKYIRYRRCVCVCVCVFTSTKYLLINDRAYQNYPHIRFISVSFKFSYSCNFQCI